MIKKQIVAVVMVFLLVAGFGCSSVIQDPPGELPSPVEPGTPQDNGQVTSPDSWPDLKSAKIIWTLDLPFPAYFPMLLDDQLIINPDQGIGAVDIQTGTLLWGRDFQEENRELIRGYSSDTMLIDKQSNLMTYLIGNYYEDDVYLEQINYLTGKVVWRELVRDMSWDDFAFIQLEGDVITIWSSFRGESDYGTEGMVVHRFDTGKPVYSFLPLREIRYSNGGIYAHPRDAAGKTSPYSLIKYDGLTGKKLWETVIETDGTDIWGVEGAREIAGYVVHNVFPDDENRYDLTDRIYTALVFDKDNGSLLWSMEGRINGSIMYDGRPFLTIFSEGKAGLVEKDSGKIHKEYLLDNMWFFSRENVVYSTGKGYTRAIDLQTGNVVWENNASEIGLFHENHGILWGYTYEYDVNNESLYITMYAIELETGEILSSYGYAGVIGGWDAPRSAHLISHNEDQYIFISSYGENPVNQFIKLVNPITGQQLWEHPMPSKYFQFIDTHEAKYVLLLEEESLELLDFGTGEKLWIFQIEGDNYNTIFSETSLAVIETPNSITASSDWVFTILNLDTGVVANRFKAKGNPVIMMGDNLFITDSSGMKLQKIAPPK